MEDELAKQVQAGASAGCGSVHRVEQQGRRTLERGLVVVYDDSGRRPEGRKREAEDRVDVQVLFTF